MRKAIRRVRAAQQNSPRQGPLPTGLLGQVADGSLMAIGAQLAKPAAREHLAVLERPRPESSARVYCAFVEPALGAVGLEIGEQLAPSAVEVDEMPAGAKATDQASLLVGQADVANLDAETTARRRSRLWSRP